MYVAVRVAGNDRIKSKADDMTMRLLVISGQCVATIDSHVGQHWLKASRDVGCISTFFGRVVFRLRGLLNLSRNRLRPCLDAIPLTEVTKRGLNPTNHKALYEVQFSFVQHTMKNNDVMRLDTVGERL
jgi:hypothetical protein